MTLNKEKNILIIGGGESGERFTHALLFNEVNNIYLSSNNNRGKTTNLSKRLNVPFIHLDKAVRNINKFDVVILATPIHTRYNILKKILKNKYLGRVLFEKPLAISKKEIMSIQKALMKNKIISLVAYNRNFDEHFINELPDLKLENKIIWPHLVSDINPYHHTLPHIISLIMFRDRYLKFISKEEDDEVIIINLETIKRKYQIVIDKVSSDINKKVSFNDIELPWTNYMVTHNCMIETLMEITYLQSNDLVNTAIKNSLLINEIENGG